MVREVVVEEEAELMMAGDRRSEACRPATVFAQ